MFMHLILFCCLCVFPLYGLNVSIINSTNRELFVKFSGKQLAVNKSDASISAGQNQSFDLTNVAAGRIYFSFDEPLSGSEPDGANPSDSDYLKRFDKVELTYQNGGKANLTAVDFYAIPMLLQTSIGGFCISQYSLDPQTTGRTLEKALIHAAIDASKTQISNDIETVRILSPVKAPTAYPDVKNQLLSAIDSSFSIEGFFFSSTGVERYSFAGMIGEEEISLTMPAKKGISIPLSGLSYSPEDVHGNAIYTCNGVYYLDGDAQPHFVAENDFYAAVYRDVISAFNLGYIGGKWGNSSDQWWSNPPFAGSNSAYNAYAAAIHQLYPGAYGFPFSDRQKTLLADLGGGVDTLTITVLADGATPQIQAIPGTLNPEAGNVLFNAALVFEKNVQNREFTFGGKQCKAGWLNDHVRGPQSDMSNGTAAQILNVAAQEGLNKYELIFGQNKYLVIVQVSDGKVAFATIAGGGNVNWSSPNLFIGGLGA